MNYAPGKTYQFRYSAETVTALQGAAEELSGLHITSFVDIEVISKCEMVLNVSNLHFSDQIVVKNDIRLYCYKPNLVSPQVVTFDLFNYW